MGSALYDAGVLVGELAIADYFEALPSRKPQTCRPKTIANWIMGELFSLINASGESIAAN